MFYLQLVFRSKLDDTAFAQSVDGAAADDWQLDDEAVTEPLSAVSSAYVAQSSSNTTVPSAATVADTHNALSVAPTPQLTGSVTAQRIYFHNGLNAASSSVYLRHMHSGPADCTVPADDKGKWPPVGLVTMRVGDHCGSVAVDDKLFSFKLLCTGAMQCPRCPYTTRAHGDVRMINCDCC